MKILILGGSGMLGHELWRHFHRKQETWVTLRRSAEGFRRYGLFNDGKVFEGIDVDDFKGVEDLITKFKPDAVLNCIGLIKQRDEARSPIPSIAINALLPHRLARVCESVGARLVQFSTDCVFSGRQGLYTEEDEPDPGDLYGRTKLLGEVTGTVCAITLRGSIVGRELETRRSLVDWFLSQRGCTVSGFRRAIYSGFTTIEMARIVELVLTRHTEISGLWHVASNAISKYELLCLLRDKFDLRVEVEAQDRFVCDRSLIANRFNQTTGYCPPEWSDMIEEMAERASEYRTG